MTKENKEAIKQLKELQDKIALLYPTQKAIDFAIKTLEQQPSEDAISREAVIRLVEQYPNIIGNRCSGLIADIKHLPSVTPQRPKGKWIEIEIDAGEFIYKCTKCGMRVINPYKYCPNCGSYNGGGEDDR